MSVKRNDNDSISKALSDDSFFISMNKSLDCKLIQSISEKSCGCSTVLIVDDVPFNI